MTAILQDVFSPETSEPNTEAFLADFANSVVKFDVLGFVRKQLRLDVDATPLVSDVIDAAVDYAISNVRHGGNLDPVTGFRYTDPTVKRIVHQVGLFIKDEYLDGWYADELEHGIYNRARTLIGLGTMKPVR